jgi:hypothetical protein
VQLVVEEDVVSFPPECLIQLLSRVISRGLQGDPVGPRFSRQLLRPLEQERGYATPAGPWYYVEVVQNPPRFHGEGGEGGIELGETQDGPGFLREEDSALPSSDPLREKTSRAIGVRGPMIEFPIGGEERDESVDILESGADHAYAGSGNGHAKGGPPSRTLNVPMAAIFRGASE